MAETGMNLTPGTAEPGDKDVWDVSELPADDDPDVAADEPAAKRAVLPLGARASRIRRRPPAPSQNTDELAEQNAKEEPPPELVYPSLDEWFTDYFASAYRRSFLGPQQRWCAQWWLHPEAVSRLDALWRAWEHLRLDPALGMSVWWREHADNHMAVLTHPDGTFKACQPGDANTPAVHRLPGRLVHQPRPTRQEPT